jgi:sterol desaturase/sphingolipid hydroxylase (fatty acid hydroxylase superfamily)
MMKYDDTKNPLSPNYRPRPTELTPREPSAFEELVGAVFGGLVAGLIGLGVFGFLMSLLYGVVILIFRHAYGVELPNPFTWLGIGWFKN